MAHSKMKIHTDESERLRAEFDNLREDVMALAHDLKAYAQHEERALGERANDRVVSLKTTGAEQFEAARTYAVEAAKTAETTVREHPAYAVAGAAALGFLLGAFTVRRH